jgi:hypothetical protein
MGILNYQSLSQFVNQELGKVTIPSGSVRRIGVLEHATNIIHYITRDIEVISQLVRNGNLNEEKASDSLANLVLEMTSFLYAAGAEHHVWRRWSSLTGLGMFLAGNIPESSQYAVLGCEWTFITVLPNVFIKSQQISEQVLGKLINSHFVSNQSEETSDEEDNAWLQLATSIPAQEHQKTEESLKVIANFWMGEDDGDWMNFHPRSYPDFHTPACVAAALARHHGFIPTSLTPEQYSFLEAGLAEPEPLPLFPTLFSLPT